MMKHISLMKKRITLCFIALVISTVAACKEDDGVIDINIIDPNPLLSIPQDKLESLYWHYGRKIYGNCKDFIEDLALLNDPAFVQHKNMCIVDAERMTKAIHKFGMTSVNRIHVLDERVWQKANLDQFNDIKCELLNLAAIRKKRYGEENCKPEPSNLFK